MIRGRLVIPRNLFAASAVTTAHMVTLAGISATSEDGLERMKHLVCDDQRQCAEVRRRHTVETCRSRGSLRSLRELILSDEPPLQGPHAAQIERLAPTSPETR